MLVINARRAIKSSFYFWINWMPTSWTVQPSNNYMINNFEMTFYFTKLSNLLTYIFNFQVFNLRAIFELTTRPEPDPTPLLKNRFMRRKLVKSSQKIHMRKFKTQGNFFKLNSSKTILIASKVFSRSRIWLNYKAPNFIACIYFSIVH